MASIAYDDIKNSILYLPINSENAVTQPRIIVAGERAGIEPYNNVIDLNGVSRDYYPSSIYYDYDGSGDDPAGAKIKREFPVTTRTPFHDFNTIPSFGAVTTNNFTNPAGAYDGSGATSAVNSNGPGSSNYFEFLYDSTEITAGNIPYGIYLKYYLDKSDDPPTQAVTNDTTDLAIMYASAGLYFHTTHYALPSATPDPIGILVIVPPDLRLIDPVYYPFDQVFIYIQTFASSGNFLLYHALPLLLNQDRLQKEAISQMRLTGQKPLKFIYQGVLPCDKEHTITGFPGGDYTASVAKQVYKEGFTEVNLEEKFGSADTAVYALQNQIEKSIGKSANRLTFGART